MTTPQKGDFIELDAMVAVVVATDENPNAPENHAGLWFGDPRNKRTSEDSAGAESPEVSFAEDLKTN